MNVPEVDPGWLQACTHVYTYTPLPPTPRTQLGACASIKSFDTIKDKELHVSGASSHVSPLVEDSSQILF